MNRLPRTKWTRSFFKSSSDGRKSSSTKTPLDYSPLEARSMLAAMPIISEFVASNDSSLQDGFGASPDWIEIHNAGDMAVDLNGYRLTDDFNVPDQWTFNTSTVLDPGAYLVVFASGNATTDPEGNLHTNFSLSAGGEYLALSDSTGTILSEFGSSTTDYPALQGDEAYGLAFNSTVTEVVTPTSSAKWLRPTTGAVDAVWTGNNFNDSSWTSSSASLGYDTNTTFDSLIIDTLPVGTTTAYVRISFNISDPSVLLDRLQMKYDDGFIAYLNGVEIASANPPVDDPAFDSTASGQNDDSDAVQYEDFDVSDFTDDLVVGNNTLAIHMLNRNSGSSDFLSVPNLITTTGGLITPVLEGRLLSPTPGQPNTTVTASPVSFSRVGGVFLNPFALTLTSTGANETIRYTTNGSEPTASSPAYNNPITVTASTQFRARSFGSLGQVGPVSVVSFSRTDTATSNFTSDLPIIVIENYGEGIPDAEFEEAAFAVYDIDETTGRSSLSNPADLTSLIGQHRRGSSTFNNAKPNLRIETRDVNGDDQNVSLLGLPSESDFILTGPFRFDRALIRDTLLHDLSNQIGRYSVRTRFVEVYGNTDGPLLNAGDYLGVYVLMENIKIDNDRVDIPQLDPTDIAEPDITGGYIIKIDRGGGWETSRGVPNRGGANFVHVDPEGADLADEQRDYIRGYVQDLEDALYGPNATDPELGYEAWLDVEAAIDHHIIRTISLEPDSLGLSTFLTKDRNGKLAFGPLWDFDRSMGSDGDTRSSDPEVWFSGVDFFEFDWWGELFNDPDFKQQWIDRWQELRQTTFSDANVLATLNGQAAQLVEAQARNFARWPENSPNGGEYAEAGLTGWEAEVSHLSGWLMERLSWIDGQLVSTATLDTAPGNISAGSQVELSTDQSGATILYTLDGTDPRDDGGQPSPSAIQYTGPFTVNATVQVTARAIGTPAESTGRTPGTSPWSPTTSGLFSVEVPATSANLRITEVHFHPAAPTAAELLEAPGTDQDEYEFIELLNTSNDTISLNGVTLGIAVVFDFTTSQITSLAPGERVLVVENIVAFEARYGTGLPVAGQYSGKLSNSGEQITLTDSFDQVIHDFTYSDITPWPVSADGDGPSLEVIDLNGNYNDPANWRASAIANGTPGAAPAAVAPQVASLVRDGGSVARPDLLGTIAVTFDQDVDVSAGDLIVRNDTTLGTVVNISSVGFSYDMPSRTASWDFSSLPDLEAAFYTFEVSDNIVSAVGNLNLDGDGDGAPGIGYTESIYVALPGDANLDGDVDISEFDTSTFTNVGDASLLLTNLGASSGMGWTDGDFNGDGDVDISQFDSSTFTNVGDASILLANLGKSVVPPSATVAASSSARLAVGSVSDPSATDSVVVTTNNIFSTKPLGEWESVWHQSVREQLAVQDAPSILSGATSNAHEAVDEFFSASESSVGTTELNDDLLGIDDWESTLDLDAI